MSVIDDKKKALKDAGFEYADILVDPPSFMSHIEDESLRNALLEEHEKMVSEIEVGSEPNDDEPLEIKVYEPVECEQKSVVEAFMKAFEEGLTDPHEHTHYTAMRMGGSEPSSIPDLTSPELGVEWRDETPADLNMKMEVPIASMEGPDGSWYTPLDEFFALKDEQNLLAKTSLIS